MSEVILGLPIVESRFIDPGNVIVGDGVILAERVTMAGLMFPREFRKQLSWLAGRWVKDALAKFDALYSPDPVVNLKSEIPNAN